MVASDAVRALVLGAVFTAAMLLFVTSMLSKATVIRETATQSCPAVTQCAQSVGSTAEQSCGAVDQVVLVLIDAMRPDFVLSALRRFSTFYGGGDGSCATAAAEVLKRTSGGAPGGVADLPLLERLLQDDKAAAATPTPYSGATLTYMEQCLRDHETASHGFFFVADSPTTTSQRLKAITTGTMPAFLEAGSNFNSDAVVEDSLVRQLHNRSIILGDDTWLGLYPPNTTEPGVPWKEAIVFPSFNVSDFDTNDAGVQQSLFEILERETLELQPGRHAKLIVAHFLGIDHVGHRINSDNKEMERKLAELNVMLRRVGQTLLRRATATRTLLVVLGDHGMTNTGDHGGDSPQETDSFLFAQLFDGGNGGEVTRFRSAAHRDLLRRTSEERWRAALDVDLTRLQQCRDAALVSPGKLGAVHQVDIAPTIALLLGRSIPFSSLGRVIPELFLLVDPAADIEAIERCNYAQLRSLFSLADLPHPPVADESLDAVRVALAQMSHYARKTRMTMNPIGMFVGTVLLFVCILSALWLTELMWLVSRDVLSLLTLVIVICRLATVFSNSFVINEDAEVATLLTVALLAACAGVSRTQPRSGGLGLTLRSRAGIDNARWSPAPLLLVAALLVRFVVPLGWRKRVHGSHVVQMEADLQTFLVGLPTLVSSSLSWAPWLASGIQWLMRELLRVAGLVSGGALFAYQMPPQRVAVVFFVIGLIYMSHGRPVEHHVVPLVLAVLARRAFQYRAVAYMIVALWPSTLTNELHAASFLMGLFAAGLPMVVRAIAHFPAMFQAVLLHLLAFTAFFAQGDQCIFTTLDWNASFVGLPSFNLVFGGLFVVCRTFGMFAMIPIALRVFHTNTRTTARVQLLYLYLLLAQAAMSCLNAYIQKRHLMLFAIFSPKILFDGVSALIGLAGFVLSYMF